MSADNWAICPRCVARAQKANLESQQGFSEIAAKLTPDQLKLVQTAVRPVNEEDFREFREDYEIYIADGKVKVSYSGHCQTCKLGLDFDHEVEIPGIDE